MMHSKKFEKIKNYYLKGYWTREMVTNAIGKWITEEEAEEIFETKENNQ